ncbi:MAG TPA: hypothetical protein VHO70_15895 [Chitinispirillaceae bacterium]|nr:hypothetical protein [Chitinispirillaceae bacterium]
MKPIIFYSFRVALFLFLIIVSSNCATPGLDTLVSFDTAWTLVYDGGKNKSNRVVADQFSSVVPLFDVPLFVPDSQEILHRLLVNY